MKYSMYNSLVKVSDNVFLLFNSFTDSYFFLNKSLEFSLKEPTLLKNQDISLYRKLVSKGIYVSDRLDEFAKLKKYAYDSLLDESSFFLIINPTMNCNLQCWYCYEKHMKSCMSKEVYNRVELFIEKTVVSGIYSFTLGFFGGEPLMEYHTIVRPLIIYSYHKCRDYHVDFQYTFTTNGTLLNPKIIRELCEFGKPSFQITLDGDEPMHNKVRFLKNGKGTYAVILANVKDLLEHDCPVTLRLNYTKDTVGTFWNALDDFFFYFENKRELLTVDFHRVWQDKEDSAVLLSVKLLVDKLVEQGFRVRFNELNEIKNACYGDRKNTAVINFNGDVFKCTAREFCTDNREGVLGEDGTILWEKDQMHRVFLKLKNPLCHHCRIAPLCGGGCSRYILEKENEHEPYCIFGQQDDKVDRFIMDHVQGLISNSLHL